MLCLWTPAASPSPSLPSAQVPVHANPHQAGDSRTSPAARSRRRGTPPALASPPPVSRATSLAWRSTRLHTRPTLQAPLAQPTHTWCTVRSSLVGGVAWQRSAGHALSGCSAALPWHLPLWHLLSTARCPFCWLSADPATGEPHKHSTKAGTMLDQASNGFKPS